MDLQLDTRWTPKWASSGLQMDPQMNKTDPQMASSGLQMDPKIGSTGVPRDLLG